ncbi:hypothetical protein RUM43_005657 [Polyplax serrata]|uniref:Uncharacterized protein n=1 Tax=Polyplax serrata TaxID=468196 RepID=A0AAN8S306_POLSC
MSLRSLFRRLRTRFHASAKEKALGCSEGHRNNEKLWAVKGCAAKRRQCPRHITSATRFECDFWHWLCGREFKETPSDAQLHYAAFYGKLPLLRRVLDSGKVHVDCSDKMHGRGSNRMNTGLLHSADMKP